MISAKTLAAQLGTFEPTDEQRAMIEAPPGPVVVVAGAGSGKTETMSARVIWAVANGLASPEQVLGLTFTRKATAELSGRLRKRLSGLARAQGGVAVGDTLTAGPTVSTYHSYAHNIVAEHGLRLGLEPGAALINKSSALAIADDIVARWTGDLSGVALSKNAVAPALVDLNAAMSEHLLTPQQCADHARGVLSQWNALPASARGGVFQPPPGSGDPLRVYQVLQTRVALQPLLEAFAEAKQALNVVDFGDLLALAVQLARRFPEVAQAERERFSLVLLDEFQDTSYGQLALLKTLFGQGHSVTAVGDPHQAIYGWRGASAANLSLFLREFATPTVRPTTLQLCTSWRNDRAVLTAANRVTAPLTASSSVDVATLKANDFCGDGQVWTSWFWRPAEELAATARWCAQQRADGDRSVAVLCRARSTFEPLAQELAALGVPYECVGGGGLLDTPEVRDAYSLLQVVDDAMAGPALARLLTMSRFHVTAQDVHALDAWARVWCKEQQAMQQETLALVHSDADAPAGDEERVEVSVIRALDALPAQDWVGAQNERFTAGGHERLMQLRQVLRDVRRVLSWPLPEVVSEAIRLLLVDVEVAAQPGHDPVAATANLEEFKSHAVGYCQATSRSSLRGFIQWLEYAEKHDRSLATSDVEVESASENRAVVTICTVHAAKGLEWDAVAVVDLAHERFPLKPRLVAADVRSAVAIPHDLRGDRDELPQWSLAGVEHAKEVNKSLTEHKEECLADDELSERRLAYVALTRARNSLWLSGSQLSSTDKEREPSDYLLSARESLLGTAALVSAGFDGDDHSEPLGERDVDGSGGVVQPWPVERNDHPVLAAERAVAQAAGVPADPDDPLTQYVAGVIADRAAQAKARRVVDFGDHLSASHLVTLAADPREFALRVRRPVPMEPRPAARRGTEFHAWIEHFYENAAVLAGLDVPGDSWNEPIADVAQLTEVFLASEWASRTPEALEVPVEFMLGDVVVRGRIDAVFRDDDGFVLVDWKSGRPPRGRHQERAALQLAAYRYAWRQLGEHSGVPTRAAYFYAATGDTVWVPEVSDQELVELVRRGVVLGSDIAG